MPSVLKPLAAALLAAAHGPLVEPGDEPPPAPSCGYPLDASEATVLALLGAFGATGKLTMSNGDQTGSLTTNGELLADASLWAAPDFTVEEGFAQIIDIGPGKKVAIELHIESVDLSETAAAHVTAMGSIATAAGGSFIDLYCDSAADGYRELTLQQFEGGVSGNVVGALTSESILFLFDTTVFEGAAGNTLVYRNGGPEPFDTGLGNFTPGSFVLIENIKEQAGLGVSDAGKAFFVTWRTSVADITMTELVPEGYTDACGNSFT